jgi:hypothetical protein
MSGKTFLIGLFHCAILGLSVGLWTSVGLGTSAAIAANYLLFLVNVLISQKASIGVTHDSK